MAATTSIEWTECTWNPVIGCRRVSPGCERCYAETMAGRIARMGGPAAERYLRVVKIDEGGKGRGRWNGRFEFVPGALAAPLQWRKPCRVFVNSMSDLFGEGVTDEQIAAVFGVMAACPQHTFQVLTKRPERMVQWFRWATVDRIDNAVAEHCGDELACNVANWLNGMSRWRNAPDDGNPLDGSKPRWPLPNVWIGVSVEDQQRADERVPMLLQVPAVVRFLSVEPLLGPVDLTPWLYVPTRCTDCGAANGAHYDTNPKGLPVLHTCTMGAPVTGEPGAVRCGKCGSLNVEELPPLSWVIAGGESGPGARPCDVAWVRSIVEQCEAAGTACFVKQLGAKAHLDCDCDGTKDSPPQHDVDCATNRCLRDRKGGDPLEWPEDLRVRQFPEVR